MPRFVILEHDHPELHWDFMLENGENLLTWKLTQIPACFAALVKNDASKNKSISEIKAQRSFPHRLLYLDYEGPISNGRGSVKRFDYGLFEWLEHKENSVTVLLDGFKLKGSLKILAEDISGAY